VNRRHFLLLSVASLWAATRAEASGRGMRCSAYGQANRRAAAGHPGAPRLSARGALSHIARPQLAVWRPALPAVMAY
jgi:hypothetical protein